VTDLTAVSSVELASELQARGYRVHLPSPGPVESVRAFVADECIVSPEATIHSLPLACAYREWALRNGGDVAQGRSFGGALQDLGFAPVRTARQRGWRGLTLR